MALRYCLLIGVEKLIDPKLGSAAYARKAAEALAGVLTSLGYEAKNRVVLVNETATRTNVDYNVKQILRSARAEDEVIIFFSGHVFSGGGSQLVCHDTRWGDLAGTSVSLGTIFSLMKGSACKHVLLLVDGGEAKWNLPAEEKDLRLGLDYAELEDSFKSNKHQVVLVSCGDSEKSYGSEVLGQGVWVQALLQAFSGKETRILDAGRYLRADGLQNYLVTSVPEILGRVFSERRVQTPVGFGSLTKDFLVADLGGILPEQTQGRGDDFPLKNATFREREVGLIKELSGFQKGFKVPEYRNNATMRMVEQAGTQEVESKAQDLYTRIKGAFGYLRKEISLERDGANVSIRAKDFNVTISLTQGETVPSEYWLTTEVAHLVNPEIIYGEVFNEVFRGKVSTLRLEFQQARELTAFIDLIEGPHQGEVAEVAYPDDCLWCEFKVGGVAARFVMRANYLDIELPGKPPREMIGALVQAGRVLSVEGGGLKLIGE